MTIAMANAQSEKAERAIGVMFSKTKYGQSYHLGYITFVSDRWQIRGDFTLTQESKGSATHKAMGLDLYTGYTLKYLHLINAYIKVVGGVTVSSESGTVGNKESDYKAIKTGAIGGLEMEKYFNTKFSVVGCFNQHYVLNSNDRWGDLRWYAQLGVRYHIALLAKE